jgi:hypothetical protein
VSLRLFLDPPRSYHTTVNHRTSDFLLHPCHAEGLLSTTYTRIRVDANPTTVKGGESECEQVEGPGICSQRALPLIICAWVTRHWRPQQSGRIQEKPRRHPGIRSLARSVIPPGFSCQAQKYSNESPFVERMRLWRPYSCRSLPNLEFCGRQGNHKLGFIGTYLSGYWQPASHRGKKGKQYSPACTNAIRFPRSCSFTVLRPALARNCAFRSFFLSAALNHHCSLCPDGEPNRCRLTWQHPFL